MSRTRRRSVDRLAGRVEHDPGARAVLGLERAEVGALARLGLRRQDGGDTLAGPRKGGGQRSDSLELALQRHRRSIESRDYDGRVLENAVQAAFAVAIVIAAGSFAVAIGGRAGPTRARDPRRCARSGRDGGLARVRVPPVGRARGRGRRADRLRAHRGRRHPARRARRRARDSRRRARPGAHARSPRSSRRRRPRTWRSCSGRWRVHARTRCRCSPRKSDASPRSGDRSSRRGSGPPETSSPICSPPRSDASRSGCAPGLPTSSARSRISRRSSGSSSSGSAP